MKNDDKNLEKYGEFICTYNEWLPLEEQKKKAKKFEKMTKKNKNSK